MAYDFLRIAFAAYLLSAFSVHGEHAGLLGRSTVVPNFVSEYAPLLFLHPEDPFRPSDILKHIKHTTPRLNFEPIQDLPSLDLGNLELLNDFGADVALTSDDDVLSLAPWLLGELPDEHGRVHNSTAACIIIVEKTAHDVDVFYFYFYSYDRGANISQVLEPLDSLFDLNDTQKAMHYGDHVGDWENNMIRFKNGEPQGIYYSQHVTGEVYKWDDKRLIMEGERPLVYSAYGSHANYATTGSHVHDKVLVDYCAAGPRWDPVQSAYFYHLDPETFKLTRLFLSTDENSNTNYTSFFYYSGRWGDKQYPDSDPRQETIPYFKLKRFQTGPTGPKAKQLVRRGLFPDHQHVESWIEWGVGVYMAWYPCCLKGWRVYVSAVVVIGGIAAVVIGAVSGLKEDKKRKGYQQVLDDIPLLERDGRSSVEFDM